MQFIDKIGPAYWSSVYIYNMYALMINNGFVSGFSTKLAALTYWQNLVDEGITVVYAAALFYNGVKLYQIR